MSEAVSFNAEQERYEIHVEGELAGFADAFESAGVVTMPHTVIYEAFEGQGLGRVLVENAVADIRSRNLKVNAVCSFVVHWFAKHPDQSDLLV